MRPKAPAKPAKTPVKPKAAQPAQPLPQPIPPIPPLAPIPPTRSKNMTPQQWSDLIRIILVAASAPGSYIVMKGILTPDQANQLIPVLVPLITTGVGIVAARLGYTSTSGPALVATVNSDAVPGVKVVAANPANAAIPQVVIDPDTGRVKVDVSVPPRAASTIPHP